MVKHCIQGGVVLIEPQARNNMSLLPLYSHYFYWRACLTLHCVAQEKKLIRDYLRLNVPMEVVRYHVSGLQGLRRPPNFRVICLNETLPAATLQPLILLLGHGLECTSTVLLRALVGLL